MPKIEPILKRIVEYKYTLVLFFLFWFLVFVGLSFFRNASLDENIYIADSVEISNILKRGEWIGNYGIGLHGFLNKLLIGIIFIFTGPSVFIATISNVLFAIFSGVIFYKILFEKVSFSKGYSLLGVTLLFSSYQFLMYTPTFYRDIPALFFFLLVVSSVLGKRSKWITGIFLLLLLDSKEHVFFTVALAFVMWVGIESIINNKKRLLDNVKEFIYSNFKLFFPSFLFLILMFTTSIVPLNIYDANILGLIDGGLAPMASNFNLEMSTDNRDVATNTDLVKVMPTFSIPDNKSTIVIYLLSFFNITFSYIGKIFYPRTFSFLSIPLIVLIPSIGFSFRYFIEGIRKKETSKLILPLVLFVYLAIYILHASISRYLLPISPVVFLFFLMFLKEFSKKESYKLKILILTLIFVFIGLYFEYSYVVLKILINALLLLTMSLIYFNKKFDSKILKLSFILVISIFSFGTCILSSYLHGQIKGYRLYGYNRECEKIISLVNKNDRLLINDISWDKLPFLLREENLGNAEWRWALREWIPKKSYLIPYKRIDTYNFYWANIEALKKGIIENEIEKMVYIKLKVLDEKEDILLQDRLEMLLDTEWLKLEKEIEMQNKVIYIFNIDEAFDD
jgi:hypothetical protein